MKVNRLSRRQFLAAASTGVFAAASGGITACGNVNKKSGTLAVLGGEPVRTKAWSPWPIWDRSCEDDMLSVLRSGDWFVRRGKDRWVQKFEKKYAELLGAKKCGTTASGTTALMTALHVLNVDAGDEVLVSPYTFIASYNAILQAKALPVFVDTDIETFTMNPKKIEERINGRTKAIMPVHILGLPCDMDRINAIAKKHNLAVVEDACQAWLAEYRGKMCGTLGDLGCFSFQNSKNLPSGEGGAIVGNDEELIDRCISYHDCGRSVGKMKGLYGGNAVRGLNFRMQHFQAVILLSQMKRIKRDADARLENALYLSSRIKDIPGIIPYKLADGATRSAYHLYPFRYKKESFNNIPKKKFLSALSAEGIPCSGGYGPQYNDGLIEESLNSKGFKRLFSEERLKKYRDEIHYPDNDQLCKEAVWFFQSLLIGSKSDMDDIADAISKIYENRDKLV